MESKYYNVIFLLLIISILLKPALFFLNTAYTWDELAYIEISKGVLKGFPYGQITATISEAPFRPPLLSWILVFTYKILGSSDVVTNFVMPIVTVFAVFAVYKLSEEFYGKKFALLSATAFSTIPATILFSHRVLPENLFALFLISSLYLLYRSLDGRRYLVPLAVVLAIAGMLRYSGFMLVLTIFILTVVFEKKWFIETIKSRWFWVSVLVFFIVLIPWFLISLENYSSLTGSLEMFYSRLSESTLYKEKIPGHYFIFWIIPVAFLTPFVLIGIKDAYKSNDKKIRIILFSLVLLLVAHELNAASLRYIVFLMPLFAILAAYSVRNNEKLLKLFVFALLVNALSGYYITSAFAYPSADTNFLIELATKKCCGRPIYFDQYVSLKQATEQLNSYYQGTTLSTDCLY